MLSLLKEVLILYTNVYTNTFKKFNGWYFIYNKKMLDFYFK